ncbi:MAG: aspartate--tRNA ligase [candidate division KSB1 bacterium]|jgi:aspartyl-tRNA synthetase|nr:aspartate--tRNA ligase [candidate division KSB1 bacterium]
MKRTHTCGELKGKNEDEKVILAGWVDKRRDHGGLIFVDLRDRYGITQLVFDPVKGDALFNKVKGLRHEYVIQIQGTVSMRPDGMINKNMPTGEIEVLVDDCTILNASETPPFLVEDDVSATEEMRLKYRYLDLRRKVLQRNLLMRHKIMNAMRNFLDDKEFIEIETPFLMKSTPEGARDFLVPSRIHKGRFYALPQSPQTYKQLLMISGFDRYFQIVKCFRDEDLRADRQPEFTQLDMEMSFIDEQDIFTVVEDLMAVLFKAILDIDIQRPIPRLTFSEAMSKYGVDKPDLRFGMEIRDIGQHVADCDFKIFTETIRKGGMVGALVLEGGARYSRKQTDGLNQFVVDLGGKGVLTAKVGDPGWDSSLSKFFSADDIKEVNRDINAKPGDLLLIIADEKKNVQRYLGHLRLKLGRDEGLIPEGSYALSWVTDFPLLEYDEDEERYVAMHHPFTSPQLDDVAELDQSPGNVKARAYDLVLNGHEIAGGSIRNHIYEHQMKVFSLLKIDQEEAKEKFGFLLDALKLGAPPHGGIAFGLDRLAMIFAGVNSLRDVIAFPKTTAALSLMDGSPSTVSKVQLKELGLKLLGQDD